MATSHYHCLLPPVSDTVYHASLNTNYCGGQLGGCYCIHVVLLSFHRLLISWLLGQHCSTRQAFVWPNQVPVMIRFCYWSDTVCMPLRVEWKWQQEVCHTWWQELWWSGGTIRYRCCTQTTCVVPRLPHLGCRPCWGNVWFRYTMLAKFQRRTPINLFQLVGRSGLIVYLGCPHLSPQFYICI